MASFSQNSLNIGIVTDSQQGPDCDDDTAINFIALCREINKNNEVESSGMRFQNTDREMNNLVYQINGLRQIAISQGAAFSVNITPHENASHWRIVDVMDACAAAGVDNLSFSKSTK